MDFYSLVFSLPQRGALQMRRVINSSLYSRCWVGMMEVAVQHIWKISGSRKLTHISIWMLYMIIEVKGVNYWKIMTHLLHLNGVFVLGREVIGLGEVAKLFFFKPREKVEVLSVLKKIISNSSLSLLPWSNKVRETFKKEGKNYLFLQTNWYLQLRWRDLFFF